MKKKQDSKLNSFEQIIMQNEDFEMKQKSKLTELMKRPI